MHIEKQGLIYDASTAQDHAKCAAFESLCRCHDGRLLCVFSVGTEKVGTDNGLQLVQSIDQGQTWQRLAKDFPTTFDGTPGSFSGGYINEIAPGRLMMNCLWFDRTHPELPIAHPETAGLLPNAYLISESNDGGKTWPAFRKVNLSPDRGATTVGEIIQLHNGNLMLCYETWKQWEDTVGSQGSRVRLSSDHGQTWSDTITVASDVNQQLYFWDGRFCMHPKTGVPLAMYWTHDAAAGKDTDIHLVIGTNDGRQWTKPKSTGIQGQVASPLVLDDGRLLCAYVHRHDPPSIRLIASENMGNTWDHEHELTLYESRGGSEAGMETARAENEYWQDMYRWTFGHPKAVQLDAKHILVTWYAGDGQRLSIHYAKVQV